MKSKTYYEMYDLLTQSMSLNHKMIDKIEELRAENAVCINKSRSAEIH